MPRDGYCSAVSDQDGCVSPNRQVPLEGKVLWRPRSDARDTTRMGKWLTWLANERAVAFGDYQRAWTWSCADPEGFWSSITEYLGVRFHDPPRAVLGQRTMPGAEWFPGATLNYADHLLRAAPDPVAVISVSQTRAGVIEIGGRELADRVFRARAGLIRLGVGQGDRVVAYLPNIPEALIAFLATASLGAIWASCPPEFGARAVIDRFAQIEPKVLLAVDGYRHRGRLIDRRAEVSAIRAGVPTVRTTVVVAYLGDDAEPAADSTSWDDFVSLPGPHDIAPVPFAHPLYVLYSSGTTGRPKAIVHSHGGILVEHLKMLALHHDMGPDDRFFWFSTTGWMMWNYSISALAVGASVVLFDGDPGYPDMEVLWRLADDLAITHFGVSAPFLMACRKTGLAPRSSVDLSRLREVGSTGAPLPASGFAWVYENVKADVVLASMSGGTDVCTAFVGGCPLLPVVAGEITCRTLGASVEAFDAHGRSLVGEQGSLVLTAPLPSMPVGFWGDTDGSRYRATYFDRYAGAWDHGDWITITERGSCVITGRSDATLNRGGVRLGTSDFYGVVEALPDVVDSLVVHIDDAESGVDELLLFVHLAPNRALDDELREQIKGELRRTLSPRHVPDELLAAPMIPKTLSGKKLEVPVKRILMGLPVAQAASAEALADPRSLDYFVALARARRSYGRG